MASITLPSLRLIYTQQQWHLKSAAAIYICFGSVKHFYNQKCLTYIQTAAQLSQNTKKQLVGLNEFYMYQYNNGLT